MKRKKIENLNVFDSTIAAYNKVRMILMLLTLQVFIS